MTSGTLVSLAGFEVRLTRKAVRNLNLRISRDGRELRISAPYRISVRQVEQFVASKRTWIHRTQQRLQAQALIAPCDLGSHERQQLLAEILRLAPPWEQRVGAKASEYRIRRMKTRWGSCNVKVGRVWLSLELARYPRECLEYVLVHELVHLHEASHNARFYRLLEEAMPDWRDRRSLLRSGRLVIEPAEPVSDARS